MAHRHLHEAKRLVDDFRSRAPQSRRALREWVERADLGLASGLIRSLLQEPDAGVREIVVEGLGERAEPEALEILLDVIDRDASEDVREAALRGLEGRATPDVLSVLLAEVHRPKRSRPPRQIVARLLGEHEDDKAVDALIELIDDDDVYVQQPAIESLLRLNRPRLKALWERIARSWAGTEWGDMAQRALEHLQARMGAAEEAASRAIVDRRTSVALKDIASDDPAVRTSAVRRLVFYRASDLVDRLLGVLGDDDDRVRSAALLALAEVGDDRARMPIIENLRSDGSEVVCAAAAQALASFPSNEALLALKEAMKGRLSGSHDLLSSVALALGEHDDEEAVDALIEILQAASPVVRNTAADMLLRLNRPRLRAIWAALASEEGPLGRTAREALRALDQQPRS